MVKCAKDEGTLKLVREVHVLVCIYTFLLLFR